MKTNKKVIIIQVFLVILAVSAIAFKLLYGKQSIKPQFGESLWRVKIDLSITGRADRARLRMLLPHDTERQRIYNEIFNHELDFYTKEYPETKNIGGYWYTQFLDGTKSISYTFTPQTISARYTISPETRIPKDPSLAYPEDVQRWLKPSKYIQSANEALQLQLRKIIGKKKKVAEINQLIYDFVRQSVVYQSEKGSKSAYETLTKMVADCGGQARLYVALSRAAKIPSRIVGGILLSEGTKNYTHVWVENYIDGQWIPFDVVNNNYAYIPRHYLEVYRGDVVLFQYSGIDDFAYSFEVSPNKMPPFEMFWSLYNIPVDFQKMILVLLLIPVGALVVSFFRVVVGIPTFGTFTPILLALAFREISVVTGLVCLSGMITIGIVIRHMLDTMKILVIPRISIILTTVVIMSLILTIFGFATAHQSILYASLFPMVIITWIIERFSVIQIEDSTKTALKAVLGTVVVALVGHYVMAHETIQRYLFTFPELLLIIMALFLMLGRYTGMRITEFWRFRYILFKRKKTQNQDHE
jgi:hypothetical protein